MESRYNLVTGYCTAWTLENKAEYSELQISCEGYNYIYIFKYSKDNHLLLRVKTQQLSAGELKQTTTVFSSLEMTPGGSIARKPGQSKMSKIISLSVETAELQSQGVWYIYHIQSDIYILYSFYNEIDLITD